MGSEKERWSGMSSRALLHRLREVRRVAEPLTATALDNGANKDVKKELKAQRQRADEAWTRAAVEAEAVVYFTRRAGPLQSGHVLRYRRRRLEPHTRPLRRRRRGGGG